MAKSYRTANTSYRDIEKMRVPSAIVTFSQDWAGPFFLEKSSPAQKRFQFPPKYLNEATQPSLRTTKTANSLLTGTRIISPSHLP